MSIFVLCCKCVNVLKKESAKIDQKYIQTNSSVFVFVQNPA